MGDRQKTWIEFATAWAEYEMILRGIGSEPKKLAVNNTALEQMIGRIVDDIASSPDDQRKLAMQLALAELARSSGNR